MISSITISISMFISVSIAVCVYIYIYMYIYIYIYEYISSMVVTILPAMFSARTPVCSTPEGVIEMKLRYLM